MTKTHKLDFTISTYEWIENVGNNLFLRIPREVVEDRYWSNLTTASKAVYLPLLKFVNKNGSAWPSQRTLAIVSGITEKTAGKGVKGLDGLPGFEKKKRITRRGHTSNYYLIKEPSPEYLQTIWFSHAYINGGNWSQLTPVAKAIFPVLKHFAWWDIDLYCGLEDLEYSPIENSEIYRDRDYDFMNAEESIICEFAGISRRSLSDAYESLVSQDLIKFLGVDDGKRVWKVFVKPKEYYKRDWLNQESERRYSNGKKY